MCPVMPLLLIYQPPPHAAAEFKRQRQGETANWTKSPHLHFSENWRLAKASCPPKLVLHLRITVLSFNQTQSLKQETESTFSSFMGASKTSLLLGTITYRNIADLYRDLVYLHWHCAYIYIERETTLRENYTALFMACLEWTKHSALLLSATPV